MVAEEVNQHLRCLSPLSFPQLNGGGQMAHDICLDSLAKEGSPFLQEGLHQHVDEADLAVGDDGRQVWLSSIHERRDGQILLHLDVPLVEELLHGTQTPLEGDRPGLGRVAHVRCMQSDGQQQPRVLLLQLLGEHIACHFGLELVEKVEVAAHVRAKHHGDHCFPEVFVLLVAECARPIAVLRVEEGEGEGEVVVLKNRDVIVRDRQRISRGLQEGVVHASVAEVVDDGGDQARQHLQVTQVLLYVLEEVVDVRCHVRRMQRVVVRIGDDVPFLHECEPVEELLPLDPKHTRKAMMLEEVKAQDRRGLGVATPGQRLAQLVKREDIKLPSAARVKHLQPRVESGLERIDHPQILRGAPARSGLIHGVDCIRRKLLLRPRRSLVLEGVFVLPGLTLALLLTSVHSRFRRKPPGDVRHRREGRVEPLHMAQRVLVDAADAVQVVRGDHLHHPAHVVLILLVVQPRVEICEELKHFLHRRAHPTVHHTLAS
mmetsp:Transcript_33103/g.82450  ORF Transcript_33103/g.82450 Transcript_33103/m.82450 type:complete len:488 (+) Transcript_33103:602-2065(+)